MATEFFSIFIIWRASNQSIMSLRLASTTADLIPYPFESGIEEQIPVLPGGIQIPVPALHMTRQTLSSLSKFVLGKSEFSQNTAVSFQYFCPLPRMNDNYNAFDINCVIHYQFILRDIIYLLMFYVIHLWKWQTQNNNLRSVSVRSESGISK